MKVFIDSSVLIEFENGRNQELLTKLLEKPALNLCLNSVVASEYFYKLLGILAGKSPMSVCESGKINEVLSEHDTLLFLSYFTLLDTPKEAIILSLSFMRTYNLLPNDALILATCKLQNIVVFASLDSDFTVACRSENIRLINMNNLNEI
jgi:uncharacterized protein